MTIEEMKARKAELGYTNETVANLSGVPLGTVQKIFAGETKAPRYDTIQKLTKVLEKTAEESFVMEPNALYEYDSVSQPVRRGRSPMEDKYLKPPKKKIGIADGKFRMPPDELLFDNEIAEMFEEF